MNRCSRSSERNHAVRDLLRVGSQRPERDDALLEPLGQREISPRGRWQLVEDQRRRFRAVAHDRIALLEQPGSRPGGRHRPVAERQLRDAAA